MNSNSALGEYMFDYERFYAALDAVRQARGLSWYGVFKQTYLVMFTNKSFLTTHPRMSPMSRAIICTWAGLDVCDFVVGQVEREQVEELAI